MRDAPALMATLDQMAGVATVTVYGDFDAFTFSRLRDRLVWVAANGPRLLVLDLSASGRFIEQIRALVAARRQLPASCLLEVRSASTVLRNLLRLTGWPGVRVVPAWSMAEPGRLPGQG